MERASPLLAKALEDAFSTTVQIEALKYVPEVLAKAKAAAQEAAMSAVEKTAPAVAHAVAEKAVHLSCKHTLSAVAQYSVQYTSSLFPVVAAKVRTVASEVAARDINNPEKVATCTRMASDVIRYIAFKSLQGAKDLAKKDAWGSDMEHAAELAARATAKNIALGNREIWRSRIEHAVEDAVREQGMAVKPAFPTPQPLSPKARTQAQEAAEAALQKCLTKIDPLDILQNMGCHSGATAASIAMDKIPTALDKAFALLRSCDYCPAPAPGLGASPAPVTPGSPASFMVLHQKKRGN